MGPTGYFSTLIPALIVKNINTVIIKSSAFINSTQITVQTFEKRVEERTKIKDKKVAFL